MLKRYRGSDLWKLTLSVVLLATCVRVWLGPVEWVPDARAQLPDSGLQRKQLLEEARKTNLLLDKLIEHLKHKAIKVRIEESKGDSNGKPAPIR